MHQPRRLHTNKPTFVVALDSIETLAIDSIASVRERACLMREGRMNKERVEGPKPSRPPMKARLLLHGAPDAGTPERLAIISCPTCLQTWWPRHPIIGADKWTHASPLGPMLWQGPSPSSMYPFVQRNRMTLDCQPPSARHPVWGAASGMEARWRGWKAETY